MAIRMASIDWKRIFVHFFFFYHPFNIPRKKVMAVDIYGDIGPNSYFRKPKMMPKIIDFCHFLPFLGCFFRSIFQKMDFWPAYVALTKVYVWKFDSLKIRGHKMSYADLYRPKKSAGAQNSLEIGQ